MVSRRWHSHHRRDDPRVGGGWTVVLSGPGRLDPLQAAATEPESLSTSIHAADRAWVVLHPEESGWRVHRTPVRSTPLAG